MPAALFQKVEVLADEVREDVQRFQDYGFTSNPPVDSEAILAFVGGNRAHGLVLRAEHRESRKKNLQPGEVAVYTQFGDYMHLDKDGNLRIKAKNIRVEGESDELFSLIEDFLTEEINLADKLSTDTTNTLLGPMQLNGFAYYAARKAALQTIKDKLTAIKAS